MTEGLAWPPTKEDLERLYLLERLSAAKIARAYGLEYASPKTAESTILYQLKKNGIARRDKAELARKATNGMVEEWVRRYQNGESLTQIASGDVSPVTVWNHLKKRGVNLRDKVEAQIEAVTKYERRPFQGDDIERAYLMGLRYGDLAVVRHGRAIRVRVSTTHPAMANLFESLFSPYGHVARYPRESRFTKYEWNLECDLEDTFEFLLRNPSLAELKAYTHEQFLAFLAGFFDAEGTIYLHRKTYGSTFEVSISNTDLQLLELILEKLEKLGLHPYIENKVQDESRLGYQKSGEISVIRMSRQIEVCRLLSLLKLTHREKLEKSSFVIQRVCGDAFGVGKDEEDDWGELIRRIIAGRDNFVELAKREFVRDHPVRKE